MNDIQKIKEFFSKPLDEKKETAVDMAKKQLDALGVKYEMSGNEFKPFKAIYRPTNKEDRWYDEFEDIIHLFNLGSAVKQSMNEVNLKQSKLSSAEYQKAKKLKDFKASDWKWNADEDLYTKVNEGELTEAYVPSNIKEFAKRKGVSSLVNKVAGWAEKVGKGIRGGTAIGYNYSTLILDMTYQGSEIRINTNNDTVTLYDEPVYSFNDFKQVYLDNQDESDNGLEERIAEALNKINEELCPAGKAYIKRRQAAGEKSSAYLSGRGVKVCKGQMSGKAKKKK